MNIFKQEKPLIEWEKTLDVWMIDLLPNQHYDMYNQLDAYKKIGSSNYKRFWGDYEKKIYEEYKLGLNRIRLCSNISSNLMDTRVKPLIEWEKEIGYYIFCNINLEDHYKKCTREEALKILYTNYFIKSWDDEADKKYIKYLEDFNLINNNYSIIKIDKKEITKNKNIFTKLKENYFNKIGRKNIPVYCQNIQINIRKDSLKKVLAIGLTLITAISSYGFIKNSLNYNKNNEKIKTSSINYEKNNINQVKNYSNQQNNDNIKIDNNNIFKSNDKKRKNIKENITNILNNIKIDKKIINQINKIDIEKVNKNKYDIELGDIITIKDNSYVYDSIYDAIEKHDGLQSYYSKDTYRYVKYIALNNNNNIIYSNNYNEIEQYKKNGAKVVGISTSLDNNNLEGYYNSNDVIVKIKTKKKI